ncbi:MAG TPA: protein kinase [Gemmataceae bacterium]|nr:protein kinase [Gemmataceae bacterium]
MPRNECLTNAEIVAFNLGEMPETLLEAAADHLEQCARCEQAARQLDSISDDVVVNLRGGSARTATQSPNPTRIGDYEVLGELGRGGMGVVYRARHIVLGRVTALKMLLAGEFSDAQQRSRFEAEAKAVARLQHPNIVQVFEVGRLESEFGKSQSYFTLEFVEGGSLAQCVAGRPQKPLTAAAWLEPLARAIQYAHERGIVHRDLKPSNVLLTLDGQLKLCDFGVAKVLTKAELNTRSGMLVGTAEYMSPEQALARPDVGPAADIYALGAMLYWMLTGRPPFQGTSVLDTLAQVCNKEPISPGRLQPGVPRDLETICLKCLQKDPANRYVSAAALADDVHRFRSGLPIQARPIGGMARGWRWCRRNPIVAALIAAIVVLLVSGASAALLVADRAMRDAENADNARNEIATRHRKLQDANKEIGRRAYAAEFLLARRAWEADDIPLMRQLLARLTPADPAEDFRGWEWHHLHRLSRSWQRTLERAPDSVADIAFSADGASIVAMVKRDFVHAWTWSSSTERILRTNQIAGGLGDRHWFSPHGTHIAVASDTRLDVYDVKSAEQIFSTPCPSPVTALAFRADGKQMAACGTKEGWGRLYDLTTRKQTATLKHPFALPEALAFTPDGLRLAVGGEHNGLAVFDVDKGRQLSSAALPHANAGATRLAFNVDGNILAAATNTDLSLWSVHPSGALAQILKPQPKMTAVRGLRFSPQGSLLAVADADRVVVWDTQAETIRVVIPAKARAVAFSPDSRSLVTAAATGIKVWSTDIDVACTRFPSVASLSFSPDGLRVAAVSFVPVGDPRHRYFPLSRTGTINEAFSNKVRLQLSDASLKSYLVFSGDGRFVAGAEDRSLNLWDATTGVARVLPPDPRQSRMVQVALSDDDRFVAGLGQEGVIVWDVQTGNILWTRYDLPRPRETIKLIDANVPPDCLAFSPGGAFLATGGLSMRVALWDVANGQEAKIRLADCDNTSCIAFSPNGRLFAGAGALDTSLRIWDLETGKVQHILHGHHQSVSSIAFTPDSQRLASIDLDNTVRVWDTRLGEELLAFKTISARGTLAFSRDGKRLATPECVWETSEIDLRRATSP